MKIKTLAIGLTIQRCFWRAVFVVFIFSFNSALAEDTEAPGNVAELEAELADIMAQGNIPGMIGAIVAGDQAVWQGALGIADVEQNRPVTRETLFRVGSISKSFVSMAALILVERGQLSLDLNMEEFLPEVGISNPWRDENPVLLKHLLEHTAGFDDIHLRDYLFSDPDVKLLDGIQYNTSSRQVRWPPGTRMSYSNIGPPIAALAIEKITGERFEEFVQREIFAPLGMTTATFFYDEAVAKSYSADGETERPYIHIGIRPSGSLNATSGDMIQWLKMLLRGGAYLGGVLISPESLTRMETPNSTLAAKQGLKAGYGLSNYVVLKDGLVYHGHSGSIDGFVSMYAYLPKQSLGYFFSVNGSNRQAVKKIDDLMRAFAVKDVELIAESKAEKKGGYRSEPKKIYSGYYEPNVPRVEFMRGVELLLGITKVEAHEDQLTLSPLFGGDRKAWSSVGSGHYIQEGDALPSLAVIETESGDIFIQGSAGTAGINLEKISILNAYTRIALICYTAVMLLSSCLFGLVWGVRKLAGRMSQVQQLSVRALPLMAILALLGAVYILLDGMSEVTHLGRISRWSVGYWLLSWLYVLLSFASLVQVWRYRNRVAQVGKAVWVHSCMVAVALVIMTGYFGYYGMIGVRFWAY